MMTVKMEDWKQRFGFRKLTVGLASVLLAVTFMGTTAMADDATPTSSLPSIAQSTQTTASTVTSGTSTAVDIAVSNPSEASAESVAASSATSAVSSAGSVNSAASSVNSIASAADSAVNSESTAASADSAIMSSAAMATAPSSVATMPEKSQVNTAGTILNDQILKDKYNIDINNLDAKSVLLLASLFHIFANEANLGADVNGNIAVGILNSGIDFGTRGDSIHLSKGDIYYIQQLAAGLQSGSFRNPEFNHVVFGKDVNVEIKDGQVYVNGMLMPNLKPEEVFKDGNATTYIDFGAVFSRLLKASNFYAEQGTSAGVIIDMSDQNNRFIDVSNAQATDNVIYVNLPYEYLEQPQPIRIYGLSQKADGPTIVINVTGLPSGNATINIQTQTLLYYGDDRQNPLANSESHAVPNHTLWNFGDTKAEIKVTSGRFMGSVLAPNATFTANVNVDGDIIANVVNIAGGESHRWDIHPVDPTPTPDPTPDPDPDPTPDPEPTPDPDPEPTPDPDPDPTPEPDLPSSSESTEEVTPPSSAEETTPPSAADVQTPVSDAEGSSPASAAKVVETAMPVDTATSSGAVAKSEVSAKALPATGAAKSHLGVAALGILLALQSLAFLLVGRKKEEEE
ncbi:collagen-binding domain-containing protein [Limosilactobacillus difficilis]|uniref:collagen-binding domain-containing protein n=1 Tax=Limosilactobacillus difficilis TaxID=2991838 RepID=UPI0024B9D587|nr:collagen-binding domain-containing protein [Limosilactobacillus difficilis]